MEPLREIRNRLLNGWQLSKMHTFEVAAVHQSFAPGGRGIVAEPQCGKSPYQSAGRRIGHSVVCSFPSQSGINARGETCLLGAKIVAGYPEPEILDIKNQELSGTLTLYSRPLSPNAGWCPHQVTLHAGIRLFRSPCSLVMTTSICNVPESIWRSTLMMRRQRNSLITF